MEKLDMQRFAQDEKAMAGKAEREDSLNREKTESRAEGTEKPTFRQMIEGEWRKEYEDAVGQRIQAAIQQRFRNQQDWKKQAEELMPLASALGKKYGLEPMDVQAILERLRNEEARNSTKDPSADKDARTRPNQSESYREWALRQHFLRLAQQAEALKRSFPDFDLIREMRNPAFVRMTAPGSGMTVRDAFYALHGDAIRLQSMRLAAWEAGERIASSVRSGASRPVENGMEKPGTAEMSLDIQNMDKQAREAYRRRIRNGETIDFVKNI
ncbi:MAG: hypothetical protein IKQ41_11775 [Clostridia bacterium]|nr:hypothetical protein [Clostridia bacterium]